MISSNCGFGNVEIPKKITPCNDGFMHRGIVIRLDEDCDRSALKKLREKPMDFVTARQIGEYIVFQTQEENIRIKGQISIE